MILYASQTNTRKNLDALRAHGWRIMISATGQWNPHGFSFALDNGAWHAFSAGKPWDEQAFERMLLRLGRFADFVTVPDIVMGGLESLELSKRWLERLSWLPGRKLIPVQDGMTPDDIRPLLSEDVGIFVGGGDQWKEQSAVRLWGPLKRETGCYLHVGRVNTARRIRVCSEAGADSIDGSGVSRFSCNIPKLTRVGAQPGLPWN